MRHNYTKKVNNVLIRQLNENDLEYLRNWRNKPDNSRFLRKVPYITTEMQKQWFDSYLNDESEMIFAIEENECIHQVVGSMALYNIKDDEAEFGKILIGEPRAHGRKIGVNAINALKQVAKKELALKSLHLLVYKDNVAAVKTYLETGFIIINEHISPNGSYEYMMKVQL